MHYNFARKKSLSSTSPNQPVYLAPKAEAFFAFAFSEQNVAFAKSSLAFGAGDQHVSKGIIMKIKCNLLAVFVFLFICNATAYAELWPLHLGDRIILTRTDDTGNSWVVPAKQCRFGNTDLFHFLST